MDPRWLPWCWAAGAAGCAVVFWRVQPWRAEWAAGIRLVRKYPASWLLPCLLLAADAAAALPAGKNMVNDESLAVLPAVARSVAESWQGVHFGPGAALIGMGLLVVNGWGMRRGFLKGVSSVTGQPGYGMLALLLMGGVALGADLALTGYGVPPVWHAAVTALAIPMVGWVAAAVLAGLLLLAETEGRAPEKVLEVRWLESAAAHSVRLWPWALGHGLVWWLGRFLPGWSVAYVTGLVAVVATLAAFAPLVFLHVKQGSGARDGARQALKFWRWKGWQPLAWLAAAALIFCVARLLTQAADEAARDHPMVLRIGLASLAGMVQIMLAVTGLGAWVGFRLGPMPELKRQRRPRS